MKLHVFTIFDAAAAAFLQPFFCRSRGEALRSFQDAVNDEKSQFHRHLGDYTLFLLGTFDDGSGLFECAPPEPIAGAASVLMKDVS